MFSSIKNVRWHKYNASLFHEAIEKGSLSWRGFSSLNLLLCWSTLILRYFFFFSLFISLLSLISSMAKTKKRERGHSRETAASSYSHLRFLCFPSVVSSPLCIYTDEYTREYTHKSVCLFTLLLRIRYTQSRIFFIPIFLFFEYLDVKSL